MTPTVGIRTVELAPPALEESDSSDHEGDSAPCRVLEDPLYQLDNLTEVDKELVEVYGDTVHLNDGAHLDGGVPDDKDWQQRWIQLTAVPSKHYDVPKGPVGRRFIEVYAKLMDGCIERLWNSEKFLVFPMVMLQRVKGTNNSHDIRRRIEHCMDLWEAGEYDQLVEDTIATARRQLPANQKQESDEH
eukprot:13643464-Ditylum_brightwellii.AAC.1